MTLLIEHDRGLGTAYERYHFYRLLSHWADRYRIESMLEGPVDGMAGVPGVHGVGLARTGIPVTTALRTAEQAEVARAIYHRAGGGARVEVRVVDGLQKLETLSPHDMVVVYHALSMVDDWQDYLTRVARLAKKLLVVTVCNPENWGVSILRAIGKVRHRKALAPPDSWDLATLGPFLWSLGRVREHTYFDCPWWPDLQVSPGQTLLDRAKKLLVSGSRSLSFTASAKDSVLAQRFVYDAERWPYFGAEGWKEELKPALERHPSFEHVSTRVQRHFAHLHACAVDVTRIQQRRRHMRTIGDDHRDGKSRGDAGGDADSTGPVEGSCTTGSVEGSGNGP